MLLMMMRANSFCPAAGYTEQSQGQTSGRIILTMNKFRTYLKTMQAVMFSLLAAFLLTSCVSTTQVVLLPNPDGKVGSLEVSDTKGSETQTLDQPWQSTQTSLLTGAPGTPKVLEEKQVRAMFQQALEVQPLQPVTYIMYFHRGSANLTTDSVKLIPQVIEIIKTRDSKNVIIIGHTDSVGSAEYNRTLSLRRARAVAAALVTKGVDRENIEVTYYGKGNPLIRTPDGVSEPQNRRVEVTVR
jgi:outer membrane protein OmpA-like peptidoglycan-associated protein